MIIATEKLTMASYYLNKLWHHYDQVETWYHFSIYRLWSQHFWWRRPLGYSDVTYSLPTEKNLWDLPILMDAWRHRRLFIPLKKLIKSTKKDNSVPTRLLFKECKLSVIFRMLALQLCCNWSEWYTWLQVEHGSIIKSDHIKFPSSWRQIFRKLLWFT